MPQLQESEPVSESMTASVSGALPAVLEVGSIQEIYHDGIKATLLSLSSGSLSCSLILRQPPLTGARWRSGVLGLHPRPVTPEQEREFLLPVTA